MNSAKTKAIKKDARPLRYEKDLDPLVERVGDARYALLAKRPMQHMTFKPGELR